ncbi:MAG TPA: cupredoxin domain-containing protein [Vicinamibacterales bacterium]|jgi:cytochrome c oxidase subunit 2|nr:cupredoxin domain-containing protein [Vicinamibacterales bacterium]
MTGGRRIPVAWCGLALIATALTGPRVATAGQPVHEIQVVASRFTFEPATIQVIAGESVRLVVRSKDGTHGFAIPKLKIDLHIPDSGDPVTAEFTAPSAGEYEIACSEFCGRGHGQMKAALVSTSVTRTNR